jgi:hypothetical protein
MKRLGVGLALVVVAVAVVVAATLRAFLSATGDTVPTPVVASFFDALVQSMRFAFRLVFVLGLVMALLVAIVSLPSHPTRWARPTQIASPSLASAPCSSRTTPRGLRRRRCHRSVGDGGRPRGGTPPRTRVEARA